MIIQLGKYRWRDGCDWYYDREVVAIDLAAEVVTVRDVDRSSWGYSVYRHSRIDVPYSRQSDELRRKYRKMKDYR